MDLKLVRHAYLPEATLGKLCAGDLMLTTLEEPWIKNPLGPGGQRRGPGKRESCVPDGTYRLVPHDGAKFKNVWVLENPDLGVWASQVPPGLSYGRAAILIHTGNTSDDTEGCILVGRSHGMLGEKHAVFSSRAALEELRAVIGRDAHTLTIRPSLGTSEM